MHRNAVLLALVALGFSWATAGCRRPCWEEGHCDFGGDDPDSWDQEQFEAVETEDTPEGDLKPDSVPMGPCQVGESWGWDDSSAGLYFAKVEDDMTNETLATCGDGNPGADIDSVCLYDSEGILKACATTVVVEDFIASDCQNDMDDKNTVLGEPDGVAGPEQYSGYFSLNGRAIVVGFDGNEIRCGDMITVVEMYAPGAAGAIENWKLSVGNSEAGPWFEASDWVTGEATVDVAWEWE